MRTTARSLLPLLAASLWLAPATSAVTIDWVTVGDPGNAADTTGFGAVATAYRVSETEVTNAQYAEFLNAKAASDPLGLYNTKMTGGRGFGGITRSGSSGSFSYSAIAGREDMPVNWVSFYDTLRFANWLHNGQGSGDTETGAYTLLSASSEPTAKPSNGASVTRNAGANIFLTSEDEWYKAAYYDALSASYFDYPARTDTQTVCAAPSATANTANCNFSWDPTEVGSYTGSASSFGTFDQGGNVMEWNEASISGGSARGLRGGAFNRSPDELAASFRNHLSPTGELVNVGFRIASPIPEPGTGLLVTVGMLGLAGWRRRNA